MLKSRLHLALCLASSKRTQFSMETWKKKFWADHLAVCSNNYCGPNITDLTIMSLDMASRNTAQFFTKKNKRTLHNERSPEFRGVSGPHSLLMGRWKGEKHCPKVMTMIWMFVGEQKNNFEGSPLANQVVLVKHFLPFGRWMSGTQHMKQPTFLYRWGDVWNETLLPLGCSGCQTLLPLGCIGSQSERYC